MVSSAIEDCSRRDAQARGFDFLHGKWSVRHSRLKHRLRGSQEWEEFRGYLHVTPILQGLGNIDENLLDAPGGSFFASSIRVFNVTSGLWSVRWADARREGIDKPVIGRFDGPVGQFYNDDVHEGRAIKVRFTYRDLGPSSAAWDQAFSADDGASWETNWKMDFSRLEAHQ